MCIKKSIYIILILLSIPLYLFPAETYELNDFFPENILDKNWIIGFTALEGVELLKGNQYLIHSIPQLLAEQLAMPLEHIYSDSEREEYQKSLLNAEISKLVNQLMNEKAAFDKLFFTNPGTSEYKNAYDNYIDKTEEIKNKISFLRTVDYSKIPFPEKSPVELYNSGEQDVLIDYPDFSVFEFARKNSIDLVISGEIEQIEGYFYIKIYAVHTESGKEVFVFENALSSVTIYDFLPGLVNDLIGIILGREWANLTIIPVPADSVVQINGEVKGIGSIQEKYISPGLVDVEVIHNGYKTVKESFLLNPFENAEIEMELKKKETKNLLLNSNPLGADVYLNSYWIGKTPIMIDLPYESQLLILQKEGYDDISYKFTEEIPARLDFTLREDLIDELSWHEKKRNRFYAVMGVWVISLPVPFIINDYIQDINDTTNLSSNIERRLEVLRFVKRAGVILTAALFVNTIVHLIEYLNYSRQLLPNGLEE